MTLKLEVGKLYKRNDGAKVYIYWKNCLENEFFGVSSGYTGIQYFDIEGRSCCSEDLLVSEWPEETSLDKFVVGSGKLCEDWRTYKTNFAGFSVMEHGDKVIIQDIYSSAWLDGFSAGHVNGEVACKAQSLENPLEPEEQSDAFTKDEINIQSLINKIKEAPYDYGVDRLGMTLDVLQAIAEEIKELKEKV